jgi:hypothetical protein
MKAKPVLSLCKAQFSKSKEDVCTISDRLNAIAVCCDTNSSQGHDDSPVVFSADVHPYVTCRKCGSSSPVVMLVMLKCVLKIQFTRLLSKETDDFEFKCTGDEHGEGFDYLTIGLPGTGADLNEYLKTHTAMTVSSTKLPEPEEEEVMEAECVTLRLPALLPARWRTRASARTHATQHKDTCPLLTQEHICAHMAHWHTHTHTPPITSSCRSSSWRMNMKGNF